jgi:hypothetical protein
VVLTSSPLPLAALRTFSGKNASRFARLPPFRRLRRLLSVEGLAQFGVNRQSQNVVVFSGSKVEICAVYVGLLETDHVAKSRAVCRTINTTARKYSLSARYGIASMAVIFPAKNAVFAPRWRCDS